LHLSRTEVALRQCQCKERKPARTVTGKVVTEQKFDIRENDTVLILLQPQR